MSSNNDESQTEVVEGLVENFENELCIHCCEANAPLVKFCRHCRAPLHPLAAINPYERVHALGFIWRAAANKPRNVMVLIGIYLYFVPSLLFHVCYLWGIYRDSLWGHPNFVFSSIFSALVVVLISAALSFMMLLKTTVNYFKWKNGS